MVAPMVKAMKIAKNKPFLGQLYDMPPAENECVSVVELFVDTDAVWVELPKEIIADPPPDPPSLLAKSGGMDVSCCRPRRYVTVGS